MIRLFYNEQGIIMYAITKEAAIDLNMPYVDCDDDHIKINLWRVDPKTKTLIPIK